MPNFSITPITNGKLRHTPVALDTLDIINFSTKSNRALDKEWEIEKIESSMNWILHASD